VHLKPDRHFVVLLFPCARRFQAYTCCCTSSMVVTIFENYTICVHVYADEKYCASCCRNSLLL